MTFILGSFVLNAQNISLTDNDIVDAVAKDTITDNAIVFPESMSESLSDLQRGWQLDLMTDDSDCKRFRCNFS